MRERFFTIMQQALESIASCVICMEQEHMYQGLDITTTYHSFVSRLDIYMRFLLNDKQEN